MEIIMSRDEQLKQRWELVTEKLSNQFADGDTFGSWMPSFI